MLLSVPPQGVPASGRDWLLPMVRVGTTSRLRPCCAPAKPSYLPHSHWKQFDSRGTRWLVSWWRLSRGQLRNSEMPQRWSWPPCGKRRVENGMRISTL